jgi:hypothetical protein
MFQKSHTDLRTEVSIDSGDQNSWFPRVVLIGMSFSSLFGKALEILLLPFLSLLLFDNILFSLLPSFAALNDSFEFKHHGNKFGILH